VVWPRNYIDYARMAGKVHWSFIERIAKGTIEEAAPEVIETLDQEETVITTGLENAELSVWLVPREL